MVGNQTGRTQLREKKRKTLVYPDGTQRAAQVGLVDDWGVMLYMFDSGNIEHFRFYEGNAYAAMLTDQLNDAHDRIESLEAELDSLSNSSVHDSKTLRAIARDILSTARNLLDFTRQIYATGDFTYDDKRAYKKRLEYYTTRFERAWPDV